MRWLRHGKWPKWMVHLHYFAIASFILLLISGMALYWPPVHTILIPYLPYLYYFHIVLGILFGVAILVPIVSRFSYKKRIRRLDWLMPMLLGSSIVFTGIIIWQVGIFAASWGSVAFRWHGSMSAVLLVWVLIHFVYKWVSYQPNSDGWNPKLVPSRRGFLRWVWTGVAGTVVLMILDPYRWWGEVISSSRHPMGEGTPSDFAAYYTVTGNYPSVDLSHYRLVVDGLVQRPRILTWRDVETLHSLEESANFHCVTGWTVPDVKWRGIHIKTLVDMVAPRANVNYVHFYSLDGVYSESLSLQEALDPTVLLAFELDGKPLLTQQGFPMRLVVPKMYGYKSIKWVNRVVFSNQPITGYWEARGYPNEAYIGSGI